MMNIMCIFEFYIKFPFRKCIVLKEYLVSDSNNI